MANIYVNGSLTIVFLNSPDSWSWKNVEHGRLGNRLQRERQFGDNITLAQYFMVSAFICLRSTNSRFFKTNKNRFNSNSWCRGQHGSKMFESVPGTMVLRY